MRDGRTGHPMDSRSECPAPLAPFGRGIAIYTTKDREVCIWEFVASVREKSKRSKWKQPGTEFTERSRDALHRTSENVAREGAKPRRQKREGSH